MAVNKERWIDLFSLIETVDYTDGMTRIIYAEQIPLMITQTYLLRRALREVGFKITSLDTHMDDEKKPYFIQYQTNIPEGLWHTKWELWNEWSQNTETIWTTPPDSESESEVESVDSDPSD